MKPIIWLGSSRRDFEKVPSDVQAVVLEALEDASRGGVSDRVIRIHGDLRDVMEIRSESREGAFRVTYTTQIEGRVYVLHVFKKKAHKGIATPKRDLDLIRRRLKNAIAQAKKN